MKVCMIGDGSVVVQELDKPVPGSREVLISMKACGVCGTDIEKIHGNYASNILGHEAVGVIAEAGKEVEGVSVGDRVFPHHHVPCYECHYCRNGSETMCPHFSKSNIHPGGLAEFFILPEWNIAHGGLFALPPKLSYRTGTLIEPLACVLRGLDKLNLNEDSTVAVIGAGPVGMLHIYALSVIGVRRIIAMDVSPDRLAFAKELGAEVVGRPDEAIIGSIHDLSDGRGADASVVATGHPQATEAGIKALRRGGRLLQFGLPHPETMLLHDVSDMFKRELVFLNSYSGVERDIGRAIGMLSEHRRRADDIISHSFKLADATAAFEMAENVHLARKIVIEN